MLSSEGQAESALGRAAAAAAAAAIKRCGSSAPPTGQRTGNQNSLFLVLSSSVLRTEIYLHFCPVVVSKRILSFFIHLVKLN